MNNVVKQFDRDGRQIDETTVTWNGKRATFAKTLMVRRGDTLEIPARKITLRSRSARDGRVFGGERI
jgi:hypothetical protein